MSVNALIRRATPGDAAAFARIFAQPAAQANTLQLPYPSAAMWTARLTENAPDLHQLVAEVDGLLVACASLRRNSEPRRAHAGEIGIGVDAAWQGRGVGRKLLAALIDLADNWLALHRIELRVFADNVAAIRLYESMGFVHEALLRGDGLRNGEFPDTAVMARLHPNPPLQRPEIRP
ncbi:GNAT family N-acetyltransferase [Niveibacterium sp. 24ML]|uniref:GNAT family N-acetyltransferase n=1 Tax=Niveibacterium sp. 24ML TaxID=2985512 RepID=UPI00226EF9D4|nr:GNAT family N-acetyltransferase [Niveibacterium sp. 24ML]MCX9155840.1 GNAT family N-acetyltransferase [Niveibacterium sp. 24ML]